MIPYLLGALGGYLIGQSQKKDVPQMGEGGISQLYSDPKKPFTDAVKNNLIIKHNIPKKEAEVLVIKHESIIESNWVSNRDANKTAIQILKKAKKMANGGVIEWSNDENEALGNWLMKTKDGKSILEKSKNAKELEKKVREYAKNHNGIAGLEIDNEDEGLDWVTFDDLMREIKSRYADGGKKDMGGDIDKGAAEIKLVLSNGVISVYHSDGTKLYSWKTKKGDWNKIWETLHKLGGEKMADGGFVKKVKDDDNTWYITYIDPTHFFLSNSPDFKGNAYHIGEFKSRPFYNEINDWLKETSRMNSGMAKGGMVKKLLDFQKQYDENENNNYHSENVVLLAKTFGTKEDLKEAKDILKQHEKEGSLTSENYKRRMKLQEKLEAAWEKEINKYAEGGVLEHGLREGDRILVANGRYAGIVNRDTDERVIVDIEEGIRKPSTLK